MSGTGWHKAALAANALAFTANTYAFATGLHPISLLCMFVNMFFFVWSYMSYQELKAIMPSISIPAISAGEDYDRRWEDPEYVKMTHLTIANEKVELGQAYTVCECTTCKRLAEPRIELPPKRAVSNSRVKNQFIVNGYVFLLPNVPHYAHGIWDERSRVGTFKWVDPATGKTMMIKAMPEIDDMVSEGYAIYSDQYVKPVKSIEFARAVVQSPNEVRDQNLRFKSKDNQESLKAYHNALNAQNDMLEKEIACHRDSFDEVNKKMEVGSRKLAPKIGTQSGIK